MRKKPLKHDSEAYQKRYVANASKKFGIRLYSVKELKEICEGLRDYLPKGFKLNSSKSNYEGLVTQINDLKQNKKEGVSTSISHIANIVLYISNIDYESLPEKDRNVKKVGKNSRHIKATLNYIAHLKNQDTVGSGIEILPNENGGETITINEWRPDTKRSFHNQGLDFLPLPLNGNRFKRFTCTVYSNSSYYRFGIKFIGGEVFGERWIETPDDNVFIHTGVGAMTDRHRDGLFTAIFEKGTRAIKGGVKSRDQFTNMIPENDEGYSFEAYLDDDNFVCFMINNQPFEKVLTSKESQTKVYIFSWADNQDYDLIVKNINIETTRL